jgi:hypothetical protein
MSTRMLPEPRLLLLGVMLAASTTGLSAANARVGERLYLLDSSGSILVTYDPKTLERLSQQITGPAVGMQSLTYGQGRLFSIETNVGVLMDKLVSIHPASGVATTVGPTGIIYSNVPSVKYDPTRDKFFVLYQEKPTLQKWHPDLYVVDPASGKMSFIARLNGAPASFAGPSTLAISPTGDAFLSQPGTGPATARIDLSTGKVTVLGRVPIGSGHFWDSSFDGAGRMWVIYDDGLDDSKDGIYIVNPIELTFEPKLVTKDYPLAGLSYIAVAPLPAMSAYCEPSSAMSCLPTIGWKGLPSASADSGFPVSIGGVPATSNGLMLFGSGAPSTPFGGASLCFAPPYHATPVSASVPAGTGSHCDGTWSTDLNPFLLAAGFAPGETLRAQWIGLDPTAPPGERRVTSNALAFELAP